MPSTLVGDHFAAVENSLRARSAIAANAGHPLHKGTPREEFVREFLAAHLGERVGIGTGEIVHANSKAGEKRNQFDIVVYRRDYPRLDIGGGVHGFLAESVVATIEVKSLLTKEDLQTAFVAARGAKALPRHLVESFSAGHQPPAILSYVVAYDGPASMATVCDWLPDIRTALGIPFSLLPSTRIERERVPAPAVDGVFMIGRGFLVFDNTPLSFMSDAMIGRSPHATWLYADREAGSLELLFWLLTAAVSGISGSWLHPIPYMQGLLPMPLGFGTG